MRRNFPGFLLRAIVAVALISFSAACKKATPANSVTPTTNTTTPVTTDTTKTTQATVYSLIWADEFNGTAVDTTKWNFEKGPGVNNEKEYYKAENASVADGNLVITAKTEYTLGYAYTSARMNTAYKMNAQYGRVEARIKLPIGTGLWPAFWMLGASINSNVSWPNCGEIDIMEHVNADSLIYGTMHWNGGSGHVQYGLSLTSSPSEYHVYAIEWDTNSIRWYVDDKLFVTGNIANNINNTGAFHHPFFVILNLAVAGDFPGQNVDVGKLPASMYVDYVRVYEAK